MKHVYEITDDNNVLVDGKQIIHTNKSYGFYERERQAYNIIDYILENEEEHLSEYLSYEQ